MQKQVLEERRGIKKNVFSCKFSKKQLWKWNLLIVQGEFGKIIGVIRREVCFLTV